MSIFKKIFENNIVDFNQLLKDGACIIDVRTSEEFSSGNIMDSKNIPLDEIKSNIKKIEKLNKAVIFCCASGIRSGQATSIAKSKGIEAYNGGGWKDLNIKLNK
tara:strand:+ start:752 stop:1063 length:312 start_codon:yes stop_codon:yes gene_type:complete